MSMRKDKTEPGKRIVIGKQAQDALSPLFMAINERMIGMRTALNVPQDWDIERHPQSGMPIAFVPQAKPQMPEGPTAVVKKPKKGR